MIVSHRRNLPLTALVSSFVQYGPDDHSKYTILANGVHIDSSILTHLLSAGGDWCLGGCCTVIATLGSILDSLPAENLASSILQDGATKWHYSHHILATHPTNS